jgi:ABC-type transport system involved in multi-copper enzyme maturation permease subunit
MRALFLKELNQGRPLLYFALAIALLIPAAHVVLRSPNLLYLAGTEQIARVWTYLLLALPPFIALLAAAGLFASESERGTLPTLFALPLSRRRIWLAKLLGGLALTVVASGFLLGIDAVLLRGVFAAPDFRAHLLDACLWAAVAFAVGIFWSTLVPNVIASLAGGFLFTCALIGGVTAMWFHLGAPLLGYPPERDLALWAFFLTPALLLASQLVVARGELLRSWPRWLFSFPVLLLGVIVIIPIVCGATRATLRYRRSRINLVTTVDYSPRASSTLAVMAASVPSDLLQQLRDMRTSVGSCGPSGCDVDLYDALTSRRYHALALDLQTGRELLVFSVPFLTNTPGADPMACSPDGRFAAVISRPTGLTWGALPWRLDTLRVFDLRRRKLIFETALNASRLGRDGSLSLAWSPTGEYLLFGGELGRYVMRPDGSALRRLRYNLRSYWSPTGDALFGTTSSGTVYRFSPETADHQAIWSPEPDTPQHGISLDAEAISPDGRWIALHEIGRTDDEYKTSESRLRLVSTDGAHERVIWRSKAERDKPFLRDVAWSSDGTALYLLLAWAAPPADERSAAQAESGNAALQPRGRHHLYVWRFGDETPTPVGPELPYPHPRLMARPASDEALIWAQDRMRQGSASYDSAGRPAIAGEALLVDPTGRWREVPAEGESTRLVAENNLVGFDDRGRLILSRSDGAVLRTFDLDTGEISQIYP